MWEVGETRIGLFPGLRARLLWESVTRWYSCPKDEPGHIVKPQGNTWAVDILKCEMTLTCLYVRLVIG
jgi:hypothetical protein